MFHRPRSYALLGIGLVFLLFLIMLLHDHNCSSQSHMKRIYLSRNDTSSQKIENPYAGSNVVAATKTSISFDEMKRIISVQKLSIAIEMAGYRYPNGKYNRTARNLDDLLMNKNGSSIKSLIVSTWRSGSSFFGDILNAHPANYYHFEPFYNMRMDRIKSSVFTEEVLHNMKALFNCEYTKLTHDANGSVGIDIIYSPNSRLWNQCKINASLCHNREFLRDFCKLFPFQSMKTVRIPLNMASKLLDDEKLDVRLVLLVRDPRPVLRSRIPNNFCDHQLDCSDPTRLCADMVSDYDTARELLTKYPKRFRVIRYEELAIEPFEHARQLFAFYGLDFHANVESFLKTHTEIDAGDMFSTFRDSTSAVFRWKTEMDFGTVDEIQLFCVTAMERWGYLPAMNATHQKHFNPVTNYVI